MLLLADKQIKIEEALMDKAVFNRFVHRFNETYSNALLPEQKNVLSRYITCKGDDIEMKIFLNEELWRISSKLKESRTNELIKESVEIDQKIQKIQDNIKNLKIETIDEELIKKVMLLQELVSEVTA